MPKKTKVVALNTKQLKNPSWYAMPRVTQRHARTTRREAMGHSVDPRYSKATIKSAKDLAKKATEVDHKMGKKLGVYKAVRGVKNFLKGRHRTKAIAIKRADGVTQKYHCLTSGVRRK